MKKILVLAAMALVGFAGTAKADSNFGPNRGGFYIEPGAFYTFKGDGKIGGANPVTGAGDISGDVSGPGAELRLGAHIHNIFFAGVEGTYTREKLNGDGYTPTGNEYVAGVFGGLQMPWITGLRVWGGWEPYAQLDFDNNNNLKSHFKDGRGWKVGAGLRIAVISLNFEYMRLNYTASDVTYNGNALNTGNPDYNHDAYMVGVSFPLSL